MKNLKRVLSLVLAIIMALALSTPALADTIDTSNMPGHEVLSALPNTVQRPVRPTTLKQAGYIDSIEWTLEESAESVFQEIVTLTDSLTADKATDTQKMEAIFNWVSQNVEYDHIACDYIEDNVINQRTREAGDPFYSYAKRMAVCEGYSRLCKLMGDIAEIPVAYITGIARNDGEHAWNAAFVDGKWLFFDATWRRWDMAPNYHTKSESFTYNNGMFAMGGSRYYNANTTSVYSHFCPGFECPANVTIPYGTTKIGYLERFGSSTGPTSVTIPDSVISIGEIAFSGCTGLTSVTIPDSVTSIEELAFTGCTGLTSVTIPDNVTDIGVRAFDGCTGLTSITVSSGNPNYASVDGVLFNKDLTALVEYPDGKRGAYVIPNSVTSIGKSAFYGCTGLTSVTIPDSVTSIENNAFQNCTGLTSVTIPDSVTSIGHFAFTGCTGLTSVTIPYSVTDIGIQAFYDCTGLTDVYYGGTKEQWKAIDMGDYNGRLTLLATIHYNADGPVETETATGTHEVWMITQYGLLPFTVDETGAIVKKRFDDVPEDAWYYDAVTTLATNSILNGYEDGLFRPDNYMTEGEMLTIIYRLASNSEPWNHTTRSTHWAADTIASLNWSDVHATYTRIGFDMADDYANRGEAIMAIFALLQDAGRVEEVFEWKPDGDSVWNVVSDYYTQVHDWTQDNNGIPDWDVIEVGRPDVNIDAHYWSPRRILAAYNFGLISGKDSAGTFDPAGKLTRAEFCQMLYNADIAGCLNCLKVTHYYGGGSASGGRGD